MTPAPISDAQAHFLLPREAARFLHCDPQLLRQQAHQDPYSLGFPVTVIGRRVRIPRAAFMRYIEEVCSGG